MSATLADKARSILAETVPPGLSKVERILFDRAFMFGALSALELILQDDRTPRELLSECVSYGRSIGTSAESAAV